MVKWGETLFEIKGFFFVCYEIMAYFRHIFKYVLIHIVLTFKIFKKKFKQLNQIFLFMTFGINWK
jgi:hypothetical protein